MARELMAYEVSPRSASKCIIVFHEVWGLVDHTRDVCKRLGKLGFAARAPNLYFGHDDILTPDNIQKAMEGVWELSLEERRDRAKVAMALEKKKASPETKKAVAVLYDQGFRDKLLDSALSSVKEAKSEFDQVATLGFCMGGGLSLKCATKSPHLKAAVCFYGEPPASEEVTGISIPILDIHANHDEIINAKVPQFVEAMLKGGKDLTLKTYPATKHGFFNDSRDAVYDRKAAGDAWDLLRWFLERNL
ncbi:MAG TPA: dienelactone hydrolase family protein [Nitrososphaerales archaeon]|nr:dienelactone hydrolase family protein [Nitrososphaerales archaeon]